MNSKGILWFIVFMFFVTSLPVWGLFANKAVMFGPLPMVIGWSYFGFLLIMIAGITLYFVEFKPWAKQYKDDKKRDS